MPVTNYYSVNGMLPGESTAGVRTDYLTDALGSVTGTVDSSGTLINTYRYKPYGGLLARRIRSYGLSRDEKQITTGRYVEREPTP